MAGLLDFIARHPGGVLSGLMHSLLLGLAIWGVPFINPKPPEAEQVIDVELIVQAPEVKEAPPQPPAAEEPPPTKAPAPYETAPPAPAMLVINQNMFRDAKSDVSKATEAARQALGKVRVAEAEKVADSAKEEQTAKIDLRSDTPQEAPKVGVRYAAQIAKPRETRQESKAKSDTPDLEPLNKPEPPKTEKQPEKQPEKSAEKQPEKPEEKPDLAKLLTAAVERTQSNNQAQPQQPNITAQPPVANRVGPPLSIGEKDGLRLQIKRCWSPPIGAANAESLIVTVRVGLSREGWLDGKPVLVAPNPVPNRLFQVAFEEAARALIECQPFKMPAEKYDQWRDLEVVFNPKDMVIR